MFIITKIRHWFTPHSTNNFRAKLLHNSGIFVLIGIIVVGNIFLRLLSYPTLNILGFTSSINVDEVVRETNEARLSAGLKPLNYNEKLADAARRKADNMFRENYWAHNSPSGKSPWTWFKAVGYNYVFAGENLAKDFGDTNRMMTAWMASPTHKDNIVNPKYSEIGVAVVPGTLQNTETVLVVQLFGTAAQGSVAVPAQVSQIKGEEIAEISVPISTPTPSSTTPIVAKTSPPKFNQFSWARTLNLVTTALFILTLIIDLILAESSKLSRRVGNNWAHIIFINIVLLITTIINAGKIL